MDMETLQNFSNARGYKTAGDMMTGAYRGYPFLARLKAQKLSVLTTVITISGKFPVKVGKQLRKQLPKRCGFSWNPRPTLICSGQGEELFTNFTSAMETVTAAFQEAGVSAPEDKCAFCGQSGCDALAIRNGAYTPVHRTCCQEQSYAAAAKAEDNAQNGNYLTGIIGAILGGVVAILPSLLTIWFMEKIYAALFFLIPLGIYYGYRLFKGKMNKAVGVITIILSLIMPIVLELLVFYISVATTYGILPSILDTTALYFQLYTVGEMFTDMIMSYVFVIFGGVVTFQQITRTSVQDVADAAAVLDTMAPYNASGAYTQE